MQRVAGRDVDRVAVEGDATQPAACAVAGAFDAGVAALEDAARFARVEVEQVSAALALAGAAAAHDRSREYLQLRRASCAPPRHHRFVNDTL